MPRRLAITGPRRVEVLDYQDSPLRPHEVRVQTEIASGKHGTTLAMFGNENFRGQTFDQDMRLFLEADGADPAPGPSRDAPRGTGTTGVGTVIEVGAEASRWQVGDRVFGLMDVSETNRCAEDRLWALGDIAPELALCVEPAYVSFHCIREAQVRYGDAVAIVGLGALGLLAVSMAAQGGAEAIIAIDPLPARRELAERLGAEQALDPSCGDAARTVHELTGGPGVDVAIELAGTYPALNTAIRCARVGGTVCSAGFYQGEAHGLWLGREWHHNRLSLVVPHGCGWGHGPRDGGRWDERRAYDAIVSMMRKGKLAADGLIHPIVSIEEGPAVFRMLEDHPDRAIKYAIRF